MPYVSLDDDEVIELLMERPHLVGLAFERIAKLRDDEAERAGEAWRWVSEWQKRAKDLGWKPPEA